MDSKDVIKTWLNRAEGAITPQSYRGGSIRCDYCSRVITPGEDVTNYLCNRLVNDIDISPDFPPFHMLRIYCEDCSRVKILDKCKGYNELLLISKIDKNKCLINFNIMDYSPSNDGIDYNPIEVWELGHDTITFDEFISSVYQTHGSIRLGPADIIDEYRLNNINPRDIYDENGDIDISDTMKNKIQNKINSLHS